MYRQKLSRAELVVAGLCAAWVLLWVLLDSERFLYLAAGFVALLFILRVCSRNSGNA